MRNLLRSCAVTKDGNGNYHLPAKLVNIIIGVALTAIVGAAGAAIVRSGTTGERLARVEAIVKPVQNAGERLAGLEAEVSGVRGELQRVNTRLDRLLDRSEE